MTPSRTYPSEEMMTDVVHLFSGNAVEGDSDDLEDERSHATQILLRQSEKARTSLRSPVWTPEFWDRLYEAEQGAHIALMALWESASDGRFCDCEACITRVVLEAVMPTITQYVEEISTD